MDIQRENYIDVAKGIGIILVVLGHVIKLNDLHDMDVVYDIIYAFHMPLFFLISGYCAGMKKSFRDISFVSQAKKVFTRLIVPYLVWSLIYLFLSGGIASAERYTAVLTLRGIAPLWFLGTLAMCELVFFLMAKGLEKLGKNRQLIVFAIIAVVSILTGFIMRIIKVNCSLSTDNFTMVGYYLYNTFGRLFISLPSYILGFILIRINFVKSIGKVWSLIGSAVLLTTVVTVVISSKLAVNCHLFYTNKYWIFTLVSLCGAVGVFLLSYSVESFGKPLVYLGQNSLAIMILHYIPFKTVKYAGNAVSPIWDNDIFVGLTATLLTILATIAAIYLVKKKFFLYK